MGHRGPNMAAIKFPQRPDLRMFSRTGDKEPTYNYLGSFKSLEVPEEYRRKPKASVVHVLAEHTKSPPSDEKPNTFTPEKPAIKVEVLGVRGPPSDGRPNTFTPEEPAGRAPEFRVYVRAPTSLAKAVEGIATQMQNEELLLGEWKTHGLSGNLHEIPSSYSIYELTDEAATASGAREFFEKYQDQWGGSLLNEGAKTFEKKDFPNLTSPVAVYPTKRLVDPTKRLGGSSKTFLADPDNLLTMVERNVRDTFQRKVVERAAKGHTRARKVQFDIEHLETMKVIWGQGVGIINPTVLRGANNRTNIDVGDPYLAASEPGPMNTIFMCLKYYGLPL